MTESYLPVENAAQVTQLPIIVERLQILSDEVQARVSQALAMEVSEATVKTVKAVRAALNRDFEILENKRKEIKAAILEPYNQFEGIYRRLITDVFTPALSTLTEQIGVVEGQVKKQREDELQSFFDEYKSTLRPDLEFLTLDRTGVKINLSCSIKSLKDTVKAVADRVCGDLEAIGAHDNSAEILVEYRRGLNLGQAISTVDKRMKEVEAQRQRAEQQRAEREARERARQERDKLFAERQDKIVPLHPEPLAPPVITKDPEPPEPEPAAQITPEPRAILPARDNDPMVSITVRITAPLSKQRALKQIFIDGGYQVEPITIPKGETA